MIVAEIAQAHDGSVGILHSYIDALAAAGVDAIKFQMHIAEAESSEHEMFRVPFSYVDKSRYDYWKRMELSLEQWKEIKDHCDKAAVEFICSPFSCKAVGLLEQVGISKYKIGSGEISNHLLLHKIAQHKRPVILSSGMSNIDELDAAVNIFKEANVEVSILQCTTAYPTQPAQWGLGIISTFKKRYNIPVGFSDHSGDIIAGLAATASGAEILEVHAVFDRRMFGPDAKASLEIDEIEKLVKGVKQVKEALANTAAKNEQVAELGALKNMFGKSLCINKNLPAGHTITFDDLDAKKPAGYGISPAEFNNVVGKKLGRSMNQWNFLTDQDIL